MNEPTMEFLVQRLDRMERQNRQLKRLGGLFLALVGSIVLMGHVFADRVVEAERFVLLGPNGEPRAVLAVAKGGSGLYLYDNKGKLRAGLVGGTADETGLHVYDQNGTLSWKAP